MDRISDLLPTRVSLLDRAKSSKDNDSWNDLLRYYQPFITKILVRTGLRGTDLEDARQRVFLKIWNGLTNYERDESRARFRNWLSTLIRNAAIDWHKANRHTRMGTSIDFISEDSLDPDEPEIENAIESEWQKYIVEIAMERLKSVFSGKAFEVFALSLQGVSSDEIASQLNIRKESVYVLRTRVKKRLSLEIKTIRIELEGDASNE